MSEDVVNEKFIVQQALAESCGLPLLSPRDNSTRTNAQLALRTRPHSRFNFAPDQNAATITVFCLNTLKLETSVLQNCCTFRNGFEGTCFWMDIILNSYNNFYNVSFIPFTLIIWAATCHTAMTNISHRSSLYFNIRKYVWNNTKDAKK